MRVCPHVCEGRRGEDDKWEEKRGEKALYIYKAVNIAAFAPTLSIR